MIMASGPHIIELQYTKTRTIRQEQYKKSLLLCFVVVVVCFGGFFG